MKSFQHNRKMVSSSSESDLEVLLQLSDWDSEDTDEEEQRRVSKSLKIGYNQTLNDAEFCFRFRLPKSVVDTVLKEIMPFVRSVPRNHTISPIHQLLLTLRFYALGTMLKSVADFVGISTSLAYRIVRDISTAITRLYNRYIVVHQEHVNKFYRIAGFPKVLGVIDCTFVRIPQSYFVGEEFRNRNGHISLNVQTVCDADMKFMNVESRWPGSTHDATIFNKSALKAKCVARKFGKNWLLGDGAYLNRAYLMTPISNPVTEAEKRYNTAHTKTWSTIERTIGAWKRRFPILSLTLRLSQANASTVIIATAVLHNISRDNNLEEIPPEVEVPVCITSLIPPKIVSIVQNSQQRDELILNCFS